MLQSLELAGFKSFADRTRLDFPSGVTIVVGPNGSGKSNVVDAIKWVLGSQSPRSLRGKEMVDVIFSGSASRSPLNMAEVTLAFANPVVGDAGRRFFDLQDPEVRFTRRVYRNGEGEYLINGHASRLRDFRELLAGTGFGADTYSIIEQGRVDAALNASPADRRVLFEEAAGISRFRLKKREAERRLERVEQNLLRLSDIVDEVESRLRRVRSQAGKAKQYREQSARLKEVRTQLGLADLDALLVEKRQLDAQHQLLGKQLEEARQQVQNDERQLQMLQGSSTQQALRQVEGKLMHVREQIARQTTTCAMERSRHAELLAEETVARKQLVSARQQEDSAAKEGQQQALRAAAEAADACQANLSEAVRKVSLFERRLEALQVEYSEAHQTEVEVQKEAQRKRSQRQKLDARIHVLEDALKELDRSIEDAAPEAATHGKLQAANQALEGAVRRSKELLQAEEQDRKLLGQLEVRLETEQKRLAEGQGELLAMRHRLEVLADEERRLAALNHDVRALFEATPQSGGRVAPQVFGLVADLLQVDVDLASMVEAALEGRTHHVVVDSQGQLLDVLQGSTDQLTTRAAFQHLDRLRSATALDQVDLSEEAGVMGRACDFVESEPRFEPLLRQLLGRTWFVDKLATAIRLSQGVGRGLSFVTYSAERIGADGTIVVGPHEDSEGVLTRRRKAGALRATVNESEQQIEGLSRTLESAQQQRSEVMNRLEKLSHEKSQAQSSLHELQQQVVRLEERWEQEERSAHCRLASLEAKRLERDRLVAEQRGLLEASQMASERAKELAARTEALQGDQSDLERKIAAERAREAELRTSLQQHTSLRTSLQQGKLAATEQGESLVQLESALAHILARRSTIEQAILDGTSGLATATVELEALRGQYRKAEEQDREERQKDRQLHERLSGNRAESERLRGLVAQVELRSRQTVTELRTLNDRMQEHGITLPSQGSGGFPSSKEVDREALRHEIDTLRRKIDTVGGVNLESLEELEDLESRFEQLSTQYQDLRQAKTSLVRLTSRINAESRELYLSSFEVVRSHFRELFQRLFGGGEADLVLVGEASDDPLERGVEIMASPPGKALSSLSLLSGGEKTMTCVALLLALFRSKPSPFCVLDEVDAALDESNIERFTSVLSEFLASTQFVVITHSKRTMVGADTLFGITMQESGVSKPVSVRFEDVGEAGYIHPRALASPQEEASARRAA